MAEESEAQVSEPTAEGGENMELESVQNGDAAKRSREDEEKETVEEGENGVAAKKQKVEKSVEEERLEELKDKEEGDEPAPEEEEKKSEPITLGPKNFSTGVEMFDYFLKFLHYWPLRLDINKYEHMVLLDLLKKGHADSDKKIGGGVRAFQIRNHPMWKNKCFFLVREDDSVDDFSFRKCVDQILPLPEEMKVKADANKVLGGRGGRGGGGGGHWAKRGGGGGRGGGGRGGFRN